MVRKVFLIRLAVVFLILGGGAFIWFWNLIAPRDKKPSNIRVLMVDADLIHSAIGQWAIEKQKQPDDQVTWNDVVPYLKSGTRLADSGGLDIFGHPYLIGPSIKDGVKIHQRSFKQLPPGVAADSSWDRYR